MTTTIVAHFVPLLVDPQASDVLAKGGLLKGGLLKGIGELLLFGLVLLVLIGVFIGFKARDRRR